MKLDLTRLLPLLQRRERIILVLPGEEPIVLLSLADYERLSPLSSSAKSARTDESTVHQLEIIDPPASSVEDDDQYYPEPLE
ncbi:MAG: hypothetical protein WC621_03060 [Patescibacteria group bacterium]